MKKAIRILQVGLASNLGGVESFVINIYRQLVQFDFLIEHDRKSIPFEAEIIKMGGHIYREYYKVSERKEPGAKSISNFFDMHPEIDGVHLNLNCINTWFRVLKEAGKRGLPIRILHSHNSNYMHKQTWKEKIYEVYVKHTMNKYATHFLACSKEAGEWMFAKREFTVVNNGIDVNKFGFSQKTRMEIRNQYHIRQDDIVIGFAGSFNYQKDPTYVIDILYELIKENSGYKLLMLGQGKLEEKIRTQIQELNLEEAVIMPGNVINVNEYMQAMDCFVLPSRFEGFGIVLLEAQASGLECFSTKNTVPESVNITKHVHFIKKEEGPARWAEVIRHSPLIRYNKNKEIKQAGFSIEDTAKQLENLYIQGGEK